MFAGYWCGEILRALFVLPSHTEGLPVALLEALAGGCSILLRDLTVTEEVAGGLGSTFRRRRKTGSRRVLRTVRTRRSVL